ncbi:MAG: caspase family protein, partial [Candidatus Marinimicrobia bacterium]|nr:caspase family protein [Candidatus Neomarinimicrobiota bacterium]
MNKSHTLLIFLLLFSALPLTAQDMITIKEDAPIHSEPNRNSRVLAFGIAGDQAEVIRFEDGFYRIRYESFGFTYEGYIHPSAVEWKKPPVRTKLEKPGALSAPPPSPPPSTLSETNIRPKSDKKPAKVIRHNPASLKKDSHFLGDFFWLLGTAGAVYGGWELTRDGYVVLGRDIMASSVMAWLMRTKLAKNRRSWGTLEMLEVTAQPFDVTGSPRWSFAPGEQGSVVLTVTNRGDRRVKGIRPKVKLNSSVMQKQFGKLKVKRGKSDGRRRYLIGGFTLEPGESMTASATFIIPSTYPETNIEIDGSLSRSIHGTTLMAVERRGERPVFATTEPEPVIAVVDVERNIPKTVENPNAYAVVFGIEQYKNVSTVTFAKRDAHWVREYFEKTLGIPEDNIYFLTDNDVSKAEFDKVFSLGGWLDKRIRDGMSDIYVYYAGHGAPDMKNRTAYLIPYDGDPNYASQTGYEVDAMTGNLSQLGARSVTVFLDACFSGANRESEILLAGARPIFMEVNPALAENVTLFSAASGT